MKVVIMAGGKGTRISSVASDIPKPMIKIEGKPVLEHELECLRDQGFTDIIITVSHLGNIIMILFQTARHQEVITVVVVLGTTWLVMQGWFIRAIEKFKIA